MLDPSELFSDSLTQFVWNSLEFMSKKHVKLSFHSPNALCHVSLIQVRSLQSLLLFSASHSFIQEIKRNSVKTGHTVDITELITQYIGVKMLRMVIWSQHRIRSHIADSFSLNTSTSLSQDHVLSPMDSKESQVGVNRGT